MCCTSRSIHQVCRVKSRNGQRTTVTTWSVGQSERSNKHTFQAHVFVKRKSVQVLALPGAQHDLGMGLTEAMVRFAARSEWALTVEDMLARRWRMLFLDARLAQGLAPRVASLLEQETGKDAALEPFLALCRQYQLPLENTNH